MAALTGERDTIRRPDIYNDLSLGIATNTTVWAGSFVGLNAAGFVVPMATATTLVALGRCEKTVKNNPGADGAKQVPIAQGVFRWGNSSAADLIAIDDIGKACYAVDDQTVALTNGTSTRSFAGTIVDVDALGVWVKSFLGQKIT